MPRIDQVIAQLAIIGSRKALAQSTRRFLVGCVAKMRKAPEEAREMATGMAAIAEHVEATQNAWVDTITEGGTFDGCDLRIWLALAEAAGVPFVPARTILSLDEDQLEHLSGPVAMPKHMRKGLGRLLAATFGAGDGEAPPAPSTTPRRCTSASPTRWTTCPKTGSCAATSAARSCSRPGPVAARSSATRASRRARTSRSAPAGCAQATGAASTRPTRATWRSSPQGHGAHPLPRRPWVQAARHVECEDPHRHGTIFAGSGTWPAECGLFFEHGAVTGVAFYYGWAGEATPENARKAFEAKAAAEKIIAAGVQAKMVPQLMDIEILKHHRASGAKMPEITREAVERFGDGFSGTLDFVETDQGMTLLEGGPGHTPVGGAHPCAFAGTGEGVGSTIVGVALKLMEHVVLADPKTWKDGDRSGAILTWEEAEALAGADAEERAETTT